MPERGHSGHTLMNYSTSGASLVPYSHFHLNNNDVLESHSFIKVVKLRQ